MSKTVKLVIVVVIVATVAVGAILLASHKNNNTPSSTNNNTTSNTSNQTVAATITYTDGGFQPSTTTVKVGDTVRITNGSQSPLSFDSDPHPVHTDEPELNVGDVEPGQSQTFTVTKKGTWGFHNHLDPTDQGTLTVE